MVVVNSQRPGFLPCAQPKMAVAKRQPIKVRQSRVVRMIFPFRRCADRLAHVPIEREMLDAELAVALQFGIVFRSKGQRQEQRQYPHNCQPGQIWGTVELFVGALAGAGEDGFEHGGGESSGGGVLVGRMVGGEQDDSVRHPVLGGVSEAVGGFAGD